MNYKEKDSKKTFNVNNAKSVGGGLFFKAEFVTDASGKITFTQTMNGHKYTYIFPDKKPTKDAVKDTRKDSGFILKSGVDKVKGLFIKKK